MFSYRYELAEDYADDDEDKQAIRGMRKRVLRKLKDQDDLVRVRISPVPTLKNIWLIYLSHSEIDRITRMKANDVTN